MRVFTVQLCRMRYAFDKSRTDRLFRVNQTNNLLALVLSDTENVVGF